MPQEEQIRKTFYEALSQPMQTVCSIPKKIGGKIIKNINLFTNYEN